MKKKNNKLDHKFDHQHIPSKPDMPFTPMGCVELLEDYAPMTGKSLSCTKCEISAASMVWQFCNQRICPVRECLKE